MNFSAKKIYHDVLPTTVTALTPAVPAGKKVIVKNVFVNNVSETAESALEIFIAKEGEELTVGKEFLHSINYKAKEKENISDLFVVLEEGEILYGKQTTANALVTVISGVEQA